MDQDREGEKVEQNLLQDCLSGESEIDEKVPDEIQDLGNKVLSGEFKWMRRRHRHDLEERADSITTSSTDDNSRNGMEERFSVPLHTAARS